MDNTNFKEHLVVLDDQTWIWEFITKRFERQKIPFVRLPSSVPIRQSWQRFRNAQRMIIHWESDRRSGGAIIEEILDVAPNFNVGEHIIVVTTNPNHEDVVYFAELGIRRIIRLRNRDKELKQAAAELDEHLIVGGDKNKMDVAWNRILHGIDTTPAEVPEEIISKLEKAIASLKPNTESARWLDASGSLSAFRKDSQQAKKYWLKALDKNPNYFRTYSNLIKFHRQNAELDEAMALMKKMQGLNKESISRLVSMGEVQMEMKDVGKAESYFKSALTRDNYCSGALNGLAEIRFSQGNLEETRALLARSHLGYKAASAMNKQGIDLVRAKDYEGALSHYTKAQYVLPSQDKGPMLFYNIGLCYEKWGKRDMAQEFLKIALIKEPNYKKAQKLLNQIQAVVEHES
jgi:tetratricopeptide (TPR) repeat protein